MFFFFILVSFILLIVGIMLLPFGTDAPLHHWPIATVGIMVGNIAIHLFLGPNPDFKEWMVLQLGGPFNPLSWLTNLYAHENVLHLLGNVLFLWVFGWVVEGKVGLLRFLLIYHFIGMTESGLSWLFCIGFSEPVPALGASGAIMGLVAISMIWAPSNNVFCPYSMMFDWDVSLMGLAFYYLASDFFFAWMSGFRISTAVLHLIGAAVGAVVGIWMFKRGLVDCEGYDVFALMAGREGDATVAPPKYVSKAHQEAQARERELARQRRKAQLREDLAKLERYFDDGHVEMALRKFAAIRKSFPNTQLSQSQIVRVIEHFVRAKQWNQVENWLKEHIDRFNANQDSMRLKLARVMILAQRRPRAGLMQLQSIDQTKLTSKSKKVYQQLVAKARKMIDEGEVEISED